MMENVTLRRWKKRDLIPHLWRELPNNIVMSILARLPLAQLFQARLVCKEWNSFISSYKFLSIYHDNVFKHYYPIIVDSFSYAMFRVHFDQYFLNQNIANEDKRLFPKKFFGYNQRQGQWEKFPTFKVLSNQAYELVDAAEGILCFKGVSNLFVYNLLMQTCTQLPPIREHWHLPTKSISILVDCNTNSYQVTMVGELYRNSIFHRGVAIYESSIRAWKTFNVPHLPQLDMSGLKMRFDKAVVLKDILYCGIIILKGYCSKIGLMIYNMQAKMWHDCIYLVPSKDRYYPFSQVVRCGGDIYMVFIQITTVSNIWYFKSIRVFRLEAITKYTPLINEYLKINEGEKVWSHIASEDIQDMRIAYNSHNEYINNVCFGYKTQIYCSMGINYIVYNVESCSWRRLPQCLLVHPFV